MSVQDSRSVVGRIEHLEEQLQILRDDLAGLAKWRETAQVSSFTFRGPWFSAKEAAAYVCCKTVNAFYEWKRRHHIVSRANGSVAKADLDRVLRVRSRRGRHPNAQANLLKSSRRAAK